jgi:hypothetical protein
MGNIPILYIIPLAVIGLVVILYCAFSRKSSPAVRRLAIIALILAILATTVCGYFIVTASGGEKGTGAGITLEQPAAGPAKVNWQELLSFGALILLLLIFLIILARRSKPAKPKAGRIQPRTTLTSRTKT